MTDLITSADIVALMKANGTTQAKLAPAVASFVNAKAAALPAPVPADSAVAKAIDSMGDKLVKALGSLTVSAGGGPTTYAAVLDPIPTKLDASRVGINVHLNYNDNNTYSDWGKVDLALTYLGVKHIRTAAPTPGNQGQGAFTWFADKGYKFCLITGAPLDGLIPAMEALETTYPGCIALIEGINEVNNVPGLSTATAQAYQASLYKAVRASSVLGHIPVAAFTDYPDHHSLADYANIHPYPNTGQSELEVIRANMLSQATVNPKLPFVITEVGFNPASSTSFANQAERLVTSLKAALSQKILRTYIYELFDTPNYGAGGTWGLFNENGTPKPAADAVKALLV